MFFGAVEEFDSGRQRGLAVRRPRKHGDAVHLVLGEPWMRLGADVDVPEVSASRLGNGSVHAEQWRPDLLDKLPCRVWQR